MDQINALRQTIMRRLHGNGVEPAITLPETVIKSSEFAIFAIQAELRALATLAEAGELDDWETEALGDISEQAVIIWRKAVATMVGRIIAG